MAAIAASLREMVECWLSPDAGTQVRVTEFGRGPGHQCRVRVHAVRPGSSISMLFFRRVDGWWSVLPPAPDRPSMQACQWPQIAG
jgi:hypothetical protein